MSVGSSRLTASGFSRREDSLHRAVSLTRKWATFLRYVFGFVLRMAGQRVALKLL